MKIDNNELANNSMTRLPISILLDISGSMEGEPIKKLNEGLAVFINEVLNDEISSLAADISIITFGGNVSLVTGFTDVHKIHLTEFFADGGTPIGEAINKSLDLLDERKKEYIENAIEYYQPWMCLMTDGHPTDNINSATVRTKDLVKNRKLTIFPVAIGNQVDMNTLSNISPKTPPLRLEGLKFKEYFEWLSGSISMVSQSQRGDSVDLLSTESWAKVSI